ncbi:hypothetical protein [Flavobacterium terrigena]|uniref:Uncharacterized protein n=1 Tax=Flavobacterium terrigena TaxID=402734 RepID=A0A1H6QF77_9FLAO|nr:hypothetical protein [Flavobacterium terrigena]SEI40536.1 hypothetical protein SAMN05660918_0379 [Flavobacterium terrigena]
MQKTTDFILDFVISISIAITACVGLLQPDFYNLETENWQTQTTGQDLVNLLLIVPSLLIASWLTLKRNSWAIMIKPGILLYITYTFTIYCFEIHYNSLFLLYCLILSLSFYRLVIFMYNNFNKIGITGTKTIATKITAFYFLIIAIFFYALWLSEIIQSSIEGNLPKSLINTGLFTNAVQVMDLAFLLPGVIIVGILLLKQSYLGFLITPALLTFFVLMDITIATLTFIMYFNKIETNLSVVVLMALLDAFSFALLIWFLKENAPIHKITEVKVDKKDSEISI